jgi:hypothetical protein
MALSPNGRTILACSASQHGTETGGGPSLFYLSTDNGTTWAQILDASSPTDPRQLLAHTGNDCSVAADAAGTLYAADAWQHGIALMRSTDDGAHWVLVTPFAGSAAADVQKAMTEQSNLTIYQRPWVVAGAADVVGLAFKTYGADGGKMVLHYAASTNGGLTFGTTSIVASWNRTDPYGDPGEPAMTTDGQGVWMAFTHGRVDVAHSADAGVTWTVAPAAWWSCMFPSISRDAGGILHLVDLEFDGSSPCSKIVYRMSKDDGATWADDYWWQDGLNLTGHQWASSPWVAGGRAGEAAVSWFGYLGTGQNATGPYLFWARVSGADQGRNHIAVQLGTTTKGPIYTGLQPAPPEFGMVRLDTQGRMRLAYSLPGTDPSSPSGFGWQSVYQPQVSGPAT